jgi:DNA-binding MurR/RpiR family transcriptional regulator
MGDPMTKNLFERVDLVSDHLTDSQRQLATYLLSNNRRAAFSNAAELALAVGVSESTVVRFARALGFRGFPDLQDFLREALLESLSPPQRMQLTGDDTGPGALDQRQFDIEAGNLGYAREHLDLGVVRELASALWRARRKYVVGLRSSRGPAVILGHFLAKIMPDTIVLTEATTVFENLQWVEEHDVLVAFSFPRYSLPTIDALRHARAIGAVAAVVTDSKLAPPTHVAAIQLVAPASSTFFGNSFVAAIAVSNLLVAECVKLESATALANLKRAESKYSARESFFSTPNPQ